MTTIQQRAEREAERRMLVIAVRALKDNENWKRLRKKLFALAPPYGTCFKEGDNHNPHAAAQRDGAQGMTRFIVMLENEAPDEEKERPEVRAEFTGDTL